MDAHHRRGAGRRLWILLDRGAGRGVHAVRGPRTGGGCHPGTHHAAGGLHYRIQRVLAFSCCGNTCRAPGTRTPISSAACGTPSAQAPSTPTTRATAAIFATQIANNNLLPGWLSATNPDIVLMMLGTNDVWSHLATSNILNAYTKLVGQMRARNPNVKLLIAKILPMTPSGCSDCPQGVVNLDNAIPGWASNATRPCSHPSPSSTSTRASTRPPTRSTGCTPMTAPASGRWKAAWYPALTAALNGSSGGGGSPTPTPSTSPSSGDGGSTSRFVGVQSGRCLDVTGASTTNGARAQLWNCNGRPELRKLDRHQHQRTTRLRQQMSRRHRRRHHRRHRHPNLGLQRPYQPAMDP